MPDRILTAMYDNQRSAETAREELIGLSVSPTDISVRHSEGAVDTAADSSEGGGFWSSLKDLFVPDYRAAERTFQLLHQVAGRAGRGEKAGTVVIQTFCPDNYAVMAAANRINR